MEHVPMIPMPGVVLIYNNEKQQYIRITYVHLVLCQVVNYLKLSSHLLGCLPLGLFSSKSPVNTHFLCCSVINIVHFLQSRQPLLLSSLHKI